MLPTGPKPAWVQEIQDSRALVAKHVQQTGQPTHGQEMYFSVAGVAYAALRTGHCQYLVLSPNGQATFTTAAPLEEPDESASDAEWDAYLLASEAFQQAVMVSEL